MRQWVEDHREELEDAAVEAAFAIKGSEISFTEEELIEAAVGAVLDRVSREVRK